MRMKSIQVFRGMETEWAEWLKKDWLLSVIPLQRAAILPRTFCNSTSFLKTLLVPPPSRPMVVETVGDYGGHVGHVRRQGQRPNVLLHPGDIQ